MTLDELVAQLRAAYGEALRSVVLYGSAAAGGAEHVAKRSDFNVLIIVNEVPLGRLRELSAVTRAWRDAGNHPPMTFTDSEWRASSDVFPMEYADILERNKVLYGNPRLMESRSTGTTCGCRWSAKLWESCFGCVAACYWLAMIQASRSSS